MPTFGDIQHSSAHGDHIPSNTFLLFSLTYSRRCCSQRFQQETSGKKEICSSCCQTQKYYCRNLKLEKRIILLWSICFQLSPPFFFRFRFLLVPIIFPLIFTSLLAAQIQCFKLKRANILSRD